MRIESLVRPFQSPRDADIRSRPQVPAVPAATPFEWGAAGSIGTVLQIFITNFSVQDSRIFTEVSRTTEKHRVENPEDSSQFVIVDRIKDIKFRNQENFGKDTYKLNN